MWPSTPTHLFTMKLNKLFLEKWRNWKKVGREKGGSSKVPSLLTSHVFLPNCDLNIFLVWPILALATHTHTPTPIYSLPFLLKIICQHSNSPPQGKKWNKNKDSAREAEAKKLPPLLLRPSNHQQRPSPFWQWWAQNHSMAQTWGWMLKAKWGDSPKDTPMVRGKAQASYLFKNKYIYL